MSERNEYGLFWFVGSSLASGSVLKLRGDDAALGLSAGAFVMVQWLVMLLVQVCLENNSIAESDTQATAAAGEIKSIQSLGLLIGKAEDVLAYFIGVFGVEVSVVMLCYSLWAVFLFLSWLAPRHLLFLGLWAAYYMSEL